MDNESGPRLAAMAAAAAEPMPDVPFVSLKSGGVVLIYGSDEKAVEAGHSLEAYLDVTVLLAPSATTTFSQPREFPVATGSIRSARGHLGAFEITVDAFALEMPGTSETAFGTPRDGATSRCDIVLDLSGRTPLFSAPELRDGYVRAHPNDPVSVQSAIAKSRALVGTFDKPRYITFSEHLCAHSRSQITGCTRCLDLCPAGAIAPLHDHVHIDANICAGCGQCASACPTGAAAYAMPPTDALMRRLRALLLTYAKAGGEHAIVLVHDEAHGRPMIDALMQEQALPPHVLPLGVNEVTQVDLESVVAAIIYGASGVRFLTRHRSRHDLSGLHQTIALADTILVGFGFMPNQVRAIETHDPEVLQAALSDLPQMLAALKVSSFLPLGGDKRSLARSMLRELHRAAPSPVDIVALPLKAPFGSVEIDVDGCTLCLACVSSCPTGALLDNAEQPMLRFTEETCIQCGLCQATCPEKVITLKPQLDFRPTASSPRILKSEQPFCCIRCGKAFGVRSTIERVIVKLAQKHWMFGSEKRLELIKMCEDCRAAAVTEEALDPYAPPRNAVRTTDDYLRDRAEQTSKAKDGENS
jgi:ferredoxin